MRMSTCDYGIPDQAGNDGVGTKTMQTTGHKKTAAVQSAGGISGIPVRTRNDGWSVRASYRPLTYLAMVW